MIKRQVVSLGEFCAVRHLIAEAGYSDQPSYPFDDIFSSLPIVNQALEDRFSVFLKVEDYLPRMNDNSWVQKEYAERFGQVVTIAHHDMRLEANQRKFRRRVDRFLDLKAADNPLFIAMVSAGAVSQESVARLRANLDEMFGHSALGIIGLGDMPPAYAIEESERLLIRFYRPMSETDGLRYKDPGDNDHLIGLIRKFVADTEGRGHSACRDEARTPPVAADLR